VNAARCREKFRNPPQQSEHFFVSTENHSPVTLQQRSGKFRGIALPAPTPDMLAEGKPPWQRPSKI
jgi:hypothetical protein